MSVIQHRRSATPGAVPSSLLAGEIGINEADGKLYFLDTGVVTAKRLVEMRTLIVRGTVAAAASLTVNLDPAVIGTWSKFEIFLSEIRPVTDEANLLLRVGDSGGIKSGASDYKITWLGLLTQHGFGRQRFGFRHRRKFDQSHGGSGNWQCGGRGRIDLAPTQHQ